MIYGVSNETIFEFTDFGRRAYGKLYTTFEPIPELLADYAVVHTTNGQANGKITVTATGGVAPYQYSDDCGGVFGSNNVFDNLPAGWYCMTTKDAVGQTVTDSVEVNSSTSATDTPRSVSAVSVRPNPTKDVATVGFTLQQSSKVRIAVYNAVGQKVVSLPEKVYSAGQQVATIDVAALPSGLYIVVVRDEGGASTARFVVRR